MIEQDLSFNSPPPKTYQHNPFANSPSGVKQHLTG